MRGSTAAPRERPCLRWLITRIFPPTRSRSPVSQEPRIPLPEWTWTNSARTRSWTNPFPEAGDKVLRVREAPAAAAQGRVDRGAVVVQEGGAVVSAAAAEDLAAAAADVVVVAVVAAV